MTTQDRIRLRKLKEDLQTEGNLIALFYNSYLVQCAKYLSIKIQIKKLEKEN